MSLGYFSLGKYYLELVRYPDAVKVLIRCTELDATYAVVLVALGDAWAGARDAVKAREAFGRVRAFALQQGHPELAEEIDEWVSEL